MRKSRVQRAAAVALGLGLMAGLVGLHITHPAEAGDASLAMPDQGDAQAVIKRGEYLTNEVARCGDCHTPRNPDGKPDASRHLQGAPTWFRPIVKPKGKWEDHSPDITASGLATKWGADKLTKFLSTGGKADAPMPAYRLSVEDARAMTAYLRSLPGKKAGGAGADKK